ncbi:cupredoxin domain-containing protein [Patescibacteria group bacterium]|nr:cupredoxin domain-containing protein [Patescibacteria group bacterium]
MDVDWNFNPNQFQVKKGIPVRWEISGINVSGCSNEIVIPKLNIRKQIIKGLNIIEFTPQEEGVLNFSCWMGMLNGRIIVTDEDGDISQNTKQIASQPMPASECDGSCGGSCNGGSGCGGGCGG